MMTNHRGMGSCRHQPQDLLNNVMIIVRRGALRDMTRRNIELVRNIVVAIAVVQRCNFDGTSRVMDEIMMVLMRCWGDINAAVHGIGCGSAFNWGGGAINMVVPLLDQRAAAHMDLYESVQLAQFHTNRYNFYGFIWSCMTQYIEHCHVCFRTLCTVVYKLVQIARHRISYSKTSET